VLPFLQKMAKRNVKGWAKRFWLMALKINLSLDLKFAYKQRKKLKTLLKLGSSEGKKLLIDKERARQFPIRYLYPFEKLRKSGKLWTALCPLHRDRKTPNFTIYPDNTFFCYSCRQGGDSIAFVQKLRNISFREALSEIGGVR